MERTRFLEGKLQFIKERKKQLKQLGNSTLQNFLKCQRKRNILYQVSKLTRKQMEHVRK